MTKTLLTQEDKSLTREQCVIFMHFYWHTELFLFLTLSFQEFLLCLLRFWPLGQNPAEAIKIHENNNITLSRKSRGSRVLVYLFQGLNEITINTFYKHHILLTLGGGSCMSIVKTISGVCYSSGCVYS